MGPLRPSRYAWRSDSPVWSMRFRCWRVAALLRPRASARVGVRPNCGSRKPIAGVMARQLPGPWVLALKETPDGLRSRAVKVCVAPRLISEATTGWAMSLAVALRLPWVHPAAGDSEAAAVSYRASGRIWLGCRLIRTGRRPGAGARAVDSAPDFPRLSNARRCCFWLPKGNPK